MSRRDQWEDTKRRVAKCGRLTNEGGGCGGRGTDHAAWAIGLTAGMATVADGTPFQFKIVNGQKR